MPTGTLTLALLALTAGAVPPDVVPMNSRNFQIPIHIAEGQRSKIKELILFASSDEGMTWTQVSSAPPDKDAFIFYAPTDGLYWFNICVVDTQGRREPPDIYKSTPRQKVLVDTLAPNVRIVSAERLGDDIVVAWEIQEDHADLATLKLEHRTPDAPAWMWTPVSISPALSGQARFRVSTFGPVLVHMQVSDHAGNVGETQMEVRQRSGAASPYTTTVASAPTPNGAAMQPAPQSPAPVPGPNGAWATQSPPNVSSAPVAQNASPAVQPATLRRNDAPGASDRAWATNPAASYQQGRPAGPDSMNRNLPQVVSAGYSPSQPPVGGPHSPVDATAPMEITNSTQATIDYEVTRLGPSGVGKVELYLTRDEGRTWEHYYEDLHPRSPITVNLPGEGIYGLRLVVTSGAGLGKKPPQPGDLPQTRIEVDTTPPVAKLFPPQPDPNRRDALLLTWSASDRNLAANPITLQYAERPEGPWQTIAKELTNTGRYQWLLSPNLPFRVYLRVLASDMAGNLGVDQTPEAVLIDLSEPEGQIKRIIKPMQRQ